ncbi:uncharacterized protein LOC113470812 [Diaphorina citri]|uniref:Uncharacterized protein LOC113470812 n=1 Tax=Diaphorina citri TaxID=121845 RepID=A0A3Q0JA03_DIACI|nr:uncharacterized protein LOC113470812 [Diaphorina citri]
MPHWSLLNHPNEAKSLSVSCILSTEFNVFVDNVRLAEFRAENSGNLEHLEIIDSIATPQYEQLRECTGRRFIKTHIPLSLLPPDLVTSGAKVREIGKSGGWKSKFSSELNMQADKWIEENLRQGKSGGWKSKFSSELNMQADKWIEENLRNTDIRFPE